MALFVNKENTRTKLQEEVAASLAEKARRKRLQEEQDLPDGITDSAYLKNTKQTTSLAWVWTLIFIAFIALLVWIVVAYR
tara:strand:- start:391 stop:630 length:240 start_codon:yes stop_codon:yes gene_type:complete